jgi:hypothetical protein
MFYIQASSQCDATGLAFNQIGHRDARAAFPSFARAMGRHQRMPMQLLSHRLPEGTCALAMHDPHKGHASQKGIIQILIKARDALLDPLSAQIQLDAGGRMRGCLYDGLGGLSNLLAGAPFEITPLDANAKIPHLYIDGIALQGCNLASGTQAPDPDRVTHANRARQNHLLWWTGRGRRGQSLLLFGQARLGLGKPLLAQCRQAMALCHLFA